MFKYSYGLLYISLLFSFNIGSINRENPIKSDQEDNSMLSEISDYLNPAELAMLDTYDKVVYVPRCNNILAAQNPIISYSIATD